jgi:4-amino-4-deoxy-L-arabinose transferase-like glycosyltransferase
MPKHLPPELSRGHPLFLVFVFGALFRIFGATVFVAHAFMFLVALGLLVSVFHIARTHWNTAVAFAATLLVMVQPLFLAQSTLLLPELPLALATLWTLHAFFRQRYLLAGICLALAIFIKETALVMGPVLGLIVLTAWIRKRPTWKSALAAVLALVLPAALYGLFLLVQKKQNGWYFFPLHEHHVNFAWAAMRGKFRDYLNFVFVEQGRYPLSILIGAWVTYRLFGKRENGPRFPHAIAYFLGLFIASLIVFSAGNFFMKRYMLCVLVPLAMLGARAAYELGREQARVLFPLVALLAGLSLNEAASPSFNYDYDMSFREVVRMQQEATTYVENTIGVDKPTLTIFPPIFGLEDPRFGYATRKFTRYSHLPMPDAEYAFVSEVYTRYTPPPGVRLELMKKFSSPYINFFVYRVIR